MTAQTPTSAVEALRARIEAALDYSGNFATAKPNIGTTEREHILGLCKLLRDASDALAASQEAPKAGDVERAEKAERERDFLVEEYERAVGCGPQGYIHCAMHLFNAITNARIDAKLAASQGDAAPAGDAVRELVVEAIEDVGRGADVYIASKIVAKKIIKAIAAAPAPAVEREAVAQIDPRDLVALREGRSDVPVFHVREPITGYVRLYTTPPAEAREPAADGNGGAVDWTQDAKTWGDALNEAAWTFTEHCPEKSALLFTNTKQPLRMAILKYAELVAARTKEST